MSLRSLPKRLVARVLGDPISRKRLVALIVGLVLVLGIGLAGLVYLTRDSGSGGTRASNGQGQGEPGQGSQGQGQGGPSTTLTPEEAADENTLTVVVPDELGDIAGRLTSKYRELNPDITTQVITGTSAEVLDRVRAGEAGDLYIEDAGILQRLGPRRYEGELREFGFNLFRILTAKGNPKGIADLNVFAADTQVVSGMCAVEVACGFLGATILDKADVVATPDVVLPSDTELAAQVAAGELDAALVRRTAARTRFKVTSAVPLPPEINQRTDYQMAQLTNTPVVNAFVEFVETNEAARQILRNRGYLPIQP